MEKPIELYNGQFKFVDAVVFFRSRLFFAYDFCSCIQNGLLFFSVTVLIFFLALLEQFSNALFFSLSRCSQITFVKKSMLWDDEIAIWRNSLLVSLRWFGDFFNSTELCGCFYFNTVADADTLTLTLCELLSIHSFSAWWADSVGSFAASYTFKRVNLV